MESYTQFITEPITLKYARKLPGDLYSVYKSLPDKKKAIYSNIVLDTVKIGYHNASEYRRRWKSIAPSIQAVNALLKTGLIERYGRDDPQNRKFYAVGVKIGG